MRLVATFALLAFLQADETPVSLLLQKLRSDSGEEREAAARDLRRMGPASRKGLEKAAADPDPDVAKRASRLLRILDLDQHVPSAVVHAHPGLVERVADAPGPLWAGLLGELASGAEGLHSEDLRRAAPVALEQASTPQEQGLILGQLRGLLLRDAGPPLLRLSKEKDPDVRGGAISALARLGSPELRGVAREMLHEDDPAVRKQGCDLLASVGASEDLPKVLGLVDDSNDLVRRAVLDSILCFDVREQEAAAPSIPRIVTFLGHEQDSVRASALLALARLGARAALKNLPLFSRDRSESVRSAAAAALVDLGGSPDVLAELALADDKDPDTRSRALWLLGLRRVKSAGPVILAHLDDSEDEVRAMAVWAAGRVELPEVLKRLPKFLEDPDVWNVRRAAVALAGRTRTATAVPALMKHFELMKTFEGFDASWALGRIGAIEAIPVMMKDGFFEPAGIRINQRFLNFREFRVSDVLPYAKETLESGTKIQQLGAAEAMRSVGDSDCAPLLLKVLRVDYVGGAAALALGELGIQAAVPPLLEVLEAGGVNAEEAGSALARLGAKQAIPPLRRRLSASQNPPKASTIDALETLDANDSRSVVIAALGHLQGAALTHAAMWLGREGRRDAIDRILEDGACHFPLNGLRRPAPWKKLCSERMGGDLEGTLVELLERISVKAGLRAEFHAGWEVSEQLKPYRIADVGGRLTAAEALLELLWLANDRYDAIVESDHIRLIDRRVAGRFWTRWAAEELNKK